MAPRFLKLQVHTGLSIKNFRRRACLAALRAQAMNMATFAATVGVSRQAVSQVLNGHWRSKRIELALAALTGYPVAVLFPPDEAAA